MDLSCSSLRARTIRRSLRRVMFGVVCLSLSLVLLQPAPLWAQSSVSAEPRQAETGDEGLAVSDLRTRWFDQSREDSGYTSYPRPQLKRADWLSLNGSWDYLITERQQKNVLPRAIDEGKILVPYPIESQLSGVRRMVGPEQTLWYYRQFTMPDSWDGMRLLLHFGAVDWVCEVFVNRQSVGIHQGGYDPFHFDVTEAMAGLGWGPHELAIAVYDPTDAGPQPRGKQVAKPEGIWYTPVTGIWQTVWLEPVHRTHVEQVEVVTEPGRDAVVLQVRGTSQGNEARYRATIAETDWQWEGTLNQPLRVPLNEPRLWSPEDPHLYSLQIELFEGGQVVDRVESYFAVRTIQVGPDAHGTLRFLLNGEPRFLFGPLDQGWWPDGLYTAPNEEAMKFDIQLARDAGFNMIRKHVKVEPAIWYEQCDRMGMLVWQDMPSGDTNAAWPLDGTELNRSEASHQIYDREVRAMIASLKTYPSIIAWIPFNEAWGQYRTSYWANEIKRIDPSRLVITASGGNDFGDGDAHDIHNYPNPEAPPAEHERAAVLGEYGGLGLPLAGHTWQGEANWGYRSFENQADLESAYLRFIDDLRPMIESRLAAAVYTQTTDVEIEVNGIATYDREVVKFNLERLSAAHARLYEPVHERTRVERSMASTLAYWRFEEGTSGEPVAHDRNERTAVAARDESGHDNHLYAYSRDNAPRHSERVPAQRIPLTGAENRGSLDDSQRSDSITRDLYTDPGRSQTHMDVINTFALNRWTIEFSVFPGPLLPDIGTLIGEDGKPVAELPQAPLQIFWDDEGRLGIELIDRAQKLRTLKSPAPLESKEWHHFVIRSDGQRLRLDRIVDGKVEALADCEIDGGIVLHPGTWTVGRGFDDDRLGRDSSSLIDEIRISARDLEDELLLWWEEQGK